MRNAIRVLLCLAALSGPAAFSAATQEAPLVPLHVRQVLLVNNTPAVLLVDEAEQRYLLMYIDFFMAHAIRMGLDGAQLERPLTHDLIGILLRRLGAQVTGVTITELKDNTYYALISVRVNGNGDVAEFDARPSDALAIAVRNRSPILAAPTLLRPIQDGEGIPGIPGAPEGPGGRGGREGPAPRGKT